MAEVQNLARQARMVFRGTIVRLNAATMSEVPISPNTAVVRVEETIQSPAVLGDQVGQEITVQLREGDEANEGDEAIFFVNPWLYGDSIAVQEVGRSSTTGAAKSVQDQIVTAASQQSDEALRQRLAEADAVVSGTVHNIAPIARTGPAPISEHDPDWWEASISVDSVLKGAVSAEAVTVLFPHSMDVMWHAAPKLEIGQEGVWLLHSQHIAEIGAPTLTVAGVLDAHPKGETERIQRLIEAGPQTQS